jgi:hypothetical protein
MTDMVRLIIWAMAAAVVACMAYGLGWVTGSRRREPCDLHTAAEYYERGREDGRAEVRAESDLAIAERMWRATR